jgi:hypothetical protein
MHYIVQDDFLPKSYIDFVRLEIRKNQNNLSREGYNNVKTLRDSRDPRFAETTYITDKKSLLYSMWDQVFWPQLGNVLDSSEDSALVHAAHTRFGKVLFSAYGNTDYYGHHIDIDLDCVVTAVLMLTLKDPIQFEGGAFLLGTEKIDFKSNRLIVFPSCREHGVEPVRLEKDIYENKRFTVQYFISSISKRGKYPDESHN